MTTWGAAMSHKRSAICAATVLLSLLFVGCTETEDPQTSPLKVGVAAVKLTPCGANDDYDGPVTASGVWGEQFTDTNGNGRWDNGEDFVDDPENTRLDEGSANKYD